MTPKEVLGAWVRAFNQADVEALAALYAPDAVNHQVANAPVHGKEAIARMFREEFAMTNMVCQPENIFTDGEWAIMEWKDPLGLRGCGFFQVVNGKIVLQRGYWDKLSFVPEAEQCGWVKDKFGLSWQIVPKSMSELLASATPEQAQRVTQAFLAMKKLDIRALEQAKRG